MLGTVMMMMIVVYRSALLVLLQDSLITTAGSPMFSELVMKVKETCYRHSCKNEL